MASLDTLTLNLPQCPICACILTDPKTLSCSHTFCEACLTNLLSSHDQVAPESVTCPICGSVTDIKGGNVSRLSTDESLKSLAIHIKDNGVPCEVCDEKARAVVYCRDCKNSMCTSCRRVHDAWKPNTAHTVLEVDDILHAKVFPKKVVCCKEHAVGSESHVCTEVCITCKKCLCIRCSFTEHEKEGHVVKNATDYEATNTAEVISLQKEADSKISALKKYLDVKEKQKQKSLHHIEAVIKEIENSYDESVQRLGEEMEILNEKCDSEKGKLNEEFDRIMAEDDTSMDVIETAGELVEKSSKVPLDEDTVIIRDSLRNELKTVLETIETPTNYAATEISSRAKKFEYEQNEELDTMEIGKVQYREWIAFPTADSMSCMAATPDGRMAVGCFSGERGIEIYSADGQLQQRVLTGIAVYGIGFLYDGRCAVRDLGNTNEHILNVSLYTQGWEKIDARFETLSWDEGGYGDLTVDRDDHIYVGYRKARKIHVFTPAGGKPVREIACGYEPGQIYAMKMSKMVVVQDFRNSARVINETGVKQHRLIKSTGLVVFPAVCKDDTILIATVHKERDRVTIERYTSELQHMATLITDHVIQKTERDYWAYVQQFTSGEIAFCTADRLYIFSKSVTPVGV